MERNVGVFACFSFLPASPGFGPDQAVQMRRATVTFLLLRNNLGYAEALTVPAKAAQSLLNATALPTGRLGSFGSLKYQEGGAFFNHFYGALIPR